MCVSGCVSGGDGEGKREREKRREEERRGRGGHKRGGQQPNSERVGGKQLTTQTADNDSGAAFLANTVFQPCWTHSLTPFRSLPPSFNTHAPAEPLWVSPLWDVSGVNEESKRQI